jgi:Domain of unknown function (DUF4185)
MFSTQAGEPTQNKHTGLSEQQKPPILSRVNRMPVLLVAVALTGCAASAPPRIQRVEFGSPIWAAGQRRAGVLFQDGAQAISVAGGTLWLFGDTFIGKPKPDQSPHRSQITGMIGTTIAFLPGGQTNLPPQLDYFIDQNGAVTNPLALFPEESAATNRMWPLGGISIGRRVYLYYSMIEQTTNPSPWNFRSTGGGLAVTDKPLRRFVRLRPDGRWKFPVEPIQVSREGNLLYLFELSSEPKGLILARVDASQIENPAAYEFFTGNGWSKNRAGVKVILREAYGQVSVSWIPAWKRYVMATSSDFFHPREIQLRQAPRLEGPWSPPTRIAVPELPGKTTTLVYGTFLHPELSDEKSLSFVATFCRLLAGDWELSNPEWMTVTFAP